MPCGQRFVRAPTLQTSIGRRISANIDHEPPISFKKPLGPFRAGSSQSANHKSLGQGQNRLSSVATQDVHATVLSASCRQDQRAVGILPTGPTGAGWGRPAFGEDARSTFGHSVLSASCRRSQPVLAAENPSSGRIPEARLAQARWLDYQAPPGRCPAVVASDGCLRGECPFRSERSGAGLLGRANGRRGQGEGVGRLSCPTSGAAPSGLAHRPLRSGRARSTIENERAGAPRSVSPASAKPQTCPGQGGLERRKLGCQHPGGYQMSTGLETVGQLLARGDQHGGQ